jgi:hypothetical protein
MKRAHVFIATILSIAAGCQDATEAIQAVQPSTAVGPTTGNARLAVVLANGTGQTPTPSARPMLEQLMARVRDYYATASHGTFHVTTTVYDWVPIVTDCSLSYVDWMAQAHDAIAGNDFTFDTNQYFAYYIATPCPGAPLGQASNHEPRVFFNANASNFMLTSPFTFVHEFGHPMGLVHEGRTSCVSGNPSGSGCGYLDYGEDENPMSRRNPCASPLDPANCPMFEPSFFHQQLLGWLPAGGQVVADSTGRTYRIDPLGAASGTLDLVVGALHVQYHAAQRPDHGEGVAIRTLQTTATNDSFYVTTIAFGNKYVLGGTSIMACRKEAGGAIVDVRFNSAAHDCGSSPPSSLTATPGSVAIAAGQSAQVAISGGSGTYSKGADPNPAVATTSLSGSTLTINGIGAGQTSAVVSDSQGASATVSISVAAAPSCRRAPSLTVSQIDANAVRKRRYAITIANRDEPRDECLQSPRFTATITPPPQGKWKLNPGVRVVAVAAGTTVETQSRIFPKSALTGGPFAFTVSLASDASPTHAVQATGSYAIGPDTAPPPPVTIQEGPYADVQLNFSDDIDTVSFGSTATVNWTSQFADACSLRRDGVAVASGLTGSMSVTFTASSRFDLTCTRGSSSATDSLLVTVSGSCTPSCSGTICGGSDGCGGTCCAGSGCSTVSCGACQQLNACGNGCTAVPDGTGCTGGTCQGGVCQSSSCTGTLSKPALFFFTPEASSGFVGVTASCAWTSSVAVPWISLSPASGTGNRTVAVFVSQNTDGVDRSATIIIAGSAMQIFQPGQ